MREDNVLKVYIYNLFSFFFLILIYIIYICELLVGIILLVFLEIYYIIFCLNIFDVECFKSIIVIMVGCYC